MDINLKDHLSESDMQAIAEDEFRKFIRHKLNTEKDLERFLSNTAYGVVSQKCDEVLDKDMMNLIRTSVEEIVGDLTMYSVFKKPDAWDREPNDMYTFLQNTLISHKPRIETIVAENVDKQTLQMLKEELKDVVESAIQKLFKEEA